MREKQKLSSLGQRKTRINGDKTLAEEKPLLGNLLGNQHTAGKTTVSRIKYLEFFVKGNQPTLGKTLVGRGNSIVEKNLCSGKRQSAQNPQPFWLSPGQPAYRWGKPSIKDQHLEFFVKGNQPTLGKTLVGRGNSIVEKNLCSGKRQSAQNPQPFWLSPGQPAYRWGKPSIKDQHLEFFVKGNQPTLGKTLVVRGNSIVEKTSGLRKPYTRKTSCSGKRHSAEKPSALLAVSWATSVPLGKTQYQGSTPRIFRQGKPAYAGKNLGS